MQADLSSLPSLLDQSRQVFFIYNLTQQQFDYVNGTVQQTFGIEPAVAQQQLPNLLHRIHPDDREYAEECLQKLRLDRLREDIELRLVGKENDVHWYCASLTHCQTPTGDDIIGGSVSDITGPKAYSQNAEKFNAKKNSTLEILSHDLAGPLHAVHTLAQTLARNPQGSLDEYSVGMLRTMEQTCREAVTMLQDFVNNEFLESVNVELHLTRVNMSERLALLLNNYQYSEQMIQLQFEFLPEPDVYAFIDENKLQQVFNNLISNAIKFTPDNGTITLTLMQEDDNQVLVTVRDTGIGIPDHLQEHLLERFTKARRPGLRGEKATGLGMSIIKTIVELHHGTVWFESTENVGTTFFVRIPQSPPPTA